MTMTPAQRAVLELAKKNQMSPMEQSAEFMLHDLTQACLDVLKGQKKLYSDLGEQGQDAIIGQISSQLKKTVYTAASILHGADVVRVPMLLQDFKAGKELKLTGIIEADDPGRYDLMDKAHSKSKVTILLQDMNYFEGMSSIQGEKDQRALSLDSETQGGAVQEPAGKGKSTPRVTEPAKKADKPMNIPKKTLEQAREFVTIQQNGTLAGLQNFLKCDITKARAIHAMMQEEGDLTAPVNDREDRDIIRKDKPKEEGASGAAGFDGFEDLNTEAKEIPVSEEKAAGALTDDIYAKIKNLVFERQSASLSTITTTVGVTDEVAADALDRLEMEGYVSEEDDLGGREVLMS